MENKSQANLDARKTIDRIVDLDFGFFTVVLDNEKALQCCLVQVETENRYEYLSKLDQSDLGCVHGICGEVNAWAIGEDGEYGHVLDRLLAEAKEEGLEIV